MYKADCINTRIDCIVYTGKQFLNIEEFIAIDYGQNEKYKNNVDCFVD